MTIFRSICGAVQPRQKLPPRLSLKPAKVFRAAFRDSDNGITALRAVDCAKAVGPRCKVTRVPVRPGANEAREFWWTPGLEGIDSRTRLKP